MRHSSVFSQILALFQRPEFAKIIREHQAERHAKGFTCWDQFVGMLFCQLYRLIAPRMRNNYL